MVELVTASRTDGLPRMLVQSGRTGRLWGNGAAQVALSATIPAGTIRPSTTLQIKGLLGKFAPNNGGWSVQARFRQGANTANIMGAASFTATTLLAPFEHEFTLSPDRKWAFSSVGSVALFGTGGNQATGFNSTNLISTGNAPVSASPRLKTGSSGIAFASYTTSPTVETILIDFDQDVIFEVLLANVTNDSAELLAFRLSALGKGESGSNIASTKATYCPGDSLTEATGATTEATGWVSMVGKARPGRPMLADGLGGQNITTIVDRVVADPICGKLWDMAFWGGINDVDSTGGGSVWWGVVQTQLARLMTFRDPAARAPLFLNYHESTDWTAGQKTAATFVNTQLAATYGANVVDVAAVVNGNAGMYADAIHLNDTGYALVATAVSAAMTAQGWTA